MLPVMSSVPIVVRLTERNWAKLPATADNWTAPEMRERYREFDMTKFTSVPVLLSWRSRPRVMLPPRYRIVAVPITSGLEPIPSEPATLGRASEPRMSRPVVTVVVPW